MSDEKLPKQIFNGLLRTGKRTQNKPRETPKKRSCEYSNRSWQLGKEGYWRKAEWRIHVDDGCSSFVKERSEHANLNYQL